MNFEKLSFEKVAPWIQVVSKIGTKVLKGRKYHQGKHECHKITEKIMEQHYETNCVKTFGAKLWNKKGY